MNEREKALVEMVLSGNLDSFEPLVTPYRKTLLTMAYRMTQNWEDAKEIAQETFLRAFKYLRKYDRKRSFKNWILQILVNVARNFMNKKEREMIMTTEDRNLFDELDKKTYSPEQIHLRQESKSQVLECLDGLSSKEREVFLLRDIDEYSIQETAKILNCSTISVRVHLSSARKKIKNRIKEKFPQLAEEEP
jgi:RNA polymerase sigma-70 factor (ECF subfamily)